MQQRYAWGTERAYRPVRFHERTPNDGADPR